MLFKRRFLAGIADGSITLAFRRWRQPTVKAGGTLTTPVGVLAIEDVVIVEKMAITEDDAARAGYASSQALKADLKSPANGTIYRIAFRYAGEDPRITMRTDDRLDEAALGALAAELERLDRAAPWTLDTVALIAAHPGRRAADLAAAIGQETALFKRNVRKLKALGLTESLEIGYRLSPRGAALRAHLGRYGRPA